MNRTLRIVLIAVAATLLAAYLLWAVCFAPDVKEDKICHGVEITIKDTLSRRFLTSKEVLRTIQAADLNPVNEKVSEIDVHKIEETVESLDVVKRAECYILQNGNVRIRIEQRNPKFRVIGEENYYVDSDRKIMNATSHTACYVPVVTGRVSRRMAQEELFDFIDWIEDHDFWNAQIEQINVTANKEIELIPRIGGHVILLGKLNNYEEKLHKLSVFYAEGLSKIGWEDYRELDLRYNNQVIGRK